MVQLAEGRLLLRKIAAADSRRTKKTSGREVTNKRPATAVAGSSGDESPDREQWAIEKDAGKFLSDAGALASYQIVILGHNAEVFLTDEAW